MMDIPHMISIEIFGTFKVVARLCCLHFCADVHLLCCQTRDVAVFAEMKCKKNFIINPFLILSRLLPFTYSGAYFNLCALRYFII